MSIVWKFYLLQACGGAAAGLLLPIWILYMFDLGFDLAEVGLFISIIFVSQLVAEIPTGIVADRFSRRGSVAIGHGCGVICLAMIVTLDSFPAMAVVWALFGIGRTLLAVVRRAQGASTGGGFSADLLQWDVDGGCCHGGRHGRLRAHGRQLGRSCWINQIVSHSYDYRF